VVLAVTHGGVIRSMICHALGLSRENYILFNAHCSRCCVIDVFGDRGTLGGLNLPAGEGG
jgi:broad specificity phosphatase PhoE